MRSWTIAFSLGVLLASRLPLLPALPMAAGLLVCGALLHYWPRYRLLSALLVGMCWLATCADYRLSQRWPDPPYPRDVWVEASVWNLPVASDHGQRVLLRLDKLCLQSQAEQCDFSRLPPDGRLVQISVYEPLSLKPGQQWRWLLRLRPPHGFANPGSLDYAAWLLQQGISATGYLRYSSGNLLLRQHSQVRRLEQLRYRLAQTLATPQAVAVLHWPQLLRALTIGDGSGISNAQWQLFAATGTTHLLVISGSHVVLVMLLLYGSSYWVASRSSGLLLRCPAHWPASLVALAGSWIYTGLAGFSVPAVRAWLMVAVLLLARLWRRQVKSWHSLGLALAAVMVFDPLAVLNSGFWLSFVAVAVLLVSASTSAGTALAWWQRWLHELRELFWLQLRISVALLPVVLVFFQQTSVLAPLVNLPLIPLLGIAVVPMALAGVALSLCWPWAGLWLLQVADMLLTVCMRLLQWSVALMPQSLFVLPALTTLGFCLLVLACWSAVFAPLRWQRWLALAVLPLVFWWQRVPAIPPGWLHLQVLDVGQGLAIIASTTHHHLLYDAGPQFSEHFDAGSNVVVPVLRQANVTRLDRVIISHADLDHAGGLPAVLKYSPQASYSSSAPGLFPVTSDHDWCRQGQTWQWDGVSFMMLHPDNAGYDYNNGSCVLLIEAGGRRVLLTGDIEAPAESLLVQRYPALQVDVLVAPHHGSKTSSTLAFVRQLAPQFVIYSTGYLNRFGHPSAVVTTRYLLLGAQQFNTADLGAVSVIISAGGELNLVGERRQNPRFWYERQ